MNTYPVSEIFKSLQGEGFNVGREVVFIRLAGCNLACEWCDTDHTAASVLDEAEICQRVARFDCRSVILTGGEPSLHDLTSLSHALRRSGVKWIGIETNGTNSLKPFRGMIDYITVSPKRGIPLDDSVWDMADELRVVNDGLSVLDFDQYVGCGARYRYISVLSFPDGGDNLFETIKLLSAVNERNTASWYLNQQIHKALNLR